MIFVFVGIVVLNWLNVVLVSMCRVGISLIVFLLVDMVMILIVLECFRIVYGMMKLVVFVLVLFVMIVMSGCG